MKKFLSLVLSFTLLSCAFCFDASAASTPDARQLLHALIDGHDNVYSVWGEPDPYFEDEAVAIYVEAREVLKDSSSTEEDCLNAVNKLVDADLNKVYIRPVVAQKTYENAIKEQNYNNWYSESDWNEYQNKLADLKAALDNITSDLELSKELTDAFHAVLKVYNKMTNEHTLKGDINGDDNVNVEDVTLLQKYIVDSENLTGAQKMLSGAEYYEQLSIKDVTAIQKYIVQLITKLPGNNIFISERDMSYFGEELPFERTFNFCICPRIWSDSQPSAQSNGYTSLDVLYKYYQLCDQYGIEP